MRIALIASVTVSLFLSACSSYRASSGSKIESTQVSRIEKGKTTREQVIAMLGHPMHTSMLGDGRRMMLYSSTEMNGEVKSDGRSFIPIAGIFFAGRHTTEGTTRRQNLQIIVNKAGVVEDYEFTDQTTYEKSENGVNETRTIDSAGGR